MALRCNCESEFSSGHSDEKSPCRTFGSAGAHPREGARGRRTTNTPLHEADQSGDREGAQPAANEKDEVGLFGPAGLRYRSKGEMPTYGD